MKQIFTFIAALFVAASVLAQAPEKMSYQAVIRDPNQGLVTNQQVGLQISILQGSMDGTAVYTETHTTSTNGNGLVTVEIGDGVSGDDFSLIDWTSGPYYLKTETDPAGGTSYSITGTSQILSVPYALYSENSGTAATAETAATATYATTAGAATSAETATYATTAGDAASAENATTAISAEAADTITGTIAESQISDLQAYLTAESDPVFAASEASNITAEHIGNLDNLSGVNTGDQDLSSLATRDNVLELDNTTAFTPDGDYEPATKLYVDEATASGHYVGELFGGGIIFWVTPDGNHGLIGSLDDLDGGGGVAWGPDGLLGVEDMSNGAANTAAIIAAIPDPNTAAVLCNDYAGGGFTDWYLPSNRELFLFCSQDIMIDAILDNDGDPSTNGFTQEFSGITNGSYWSSTEWSATESWSFRFSTGQHTTVTRTNLRRVRAIRAF